MNNIVFLIVLYKKNIETSETLQSIINLDNHRFENLTKIYLYDNSTEHIKKNNILEYQNKINIPIEYIYNGYNRSLSSIYNDTITKISINDILVIWDHDSIIPKNYLNILNIALNKNPNVDLFLPQIYFDNNLVSPSKNIYFTGSYFKEINSGIIKSKNISAINSGMAIRGNFLKNEFSGYNEDICFYGTDNDFMFKYSHLKEFLYVLDIKIIHELNYYANSNQVDIKRRLKDMKNGALKLMKNYPIYIRILAQIYWFLYSAKIYICLSIKALKSNN